MGYDCIMGLGRTGLSCVRFLQANGRACRIMDSRFNPPELMELQERFPKVPVHLGGWRSDWLFQAQRIIVSPGISLKTPILIEARSKGVEIIGDIELFARAVQVPVIGITGTNGKSTVTSLVGAILRGAGVKVLCGGNLGPPALDLLEDPKVEVIVLELSSFQLEAVNSLQLLSAAILNISPDHLDRYDSYEEYKAAKHKIYHHCQIKVCAREDEVTWPKPTEQVITFGLDKPTGKNYGLFEGNLVCGDTPIIPASNLTLAGSGREVNALAACALVSPLNVDDEILSRVLGEFTGLAHRCEWVLKYREVDWYNDSKGTNVGATEAAVEHLATQYTSIILLLGGEGKGADFSHMSERLHKKPIQVITFGRDGNKINAALMDKINCTGVATLAEAVTTAAQQANPGDCVLFSPACASYDAFKGFAHRGEVYKKLVKELA